MNASLHAFATLLALSLVSVALQYRKQPTWLMNSKIMSKNVSNGDRDDSRSSCRRECRLTRSNKILYTAPVRPAGLNDRKSVISSLSELAGYLCAEVGLPPPTRLLHRRHNNNRVLDPRIVWADFVDFAFIDGGQPTVRTLPESRNISKKNNYLSFIQKEQEQNDDGVKWIYLQTTKLDQLIEHFEIAERALGNQDLVSFASNATNKGVGFVWDIRVDWYACVSVLKKLLEDRKNSSMTPNMLGVGSCKYTKERIPQSVQLIANTTRDFIVQKTRDHMPFDEHVQTRYGYLHIRRGDAIKQCNTSIARMRSYLQCSFQVNGTADVTSRDDVAQASHFTVIFSSDESDSSYRQAIRNLVEHDLVELQGSKNRLMNFTFVDFDDVVSHVLKVQNTTQRHITNNNFYLFLVESIVKKQLGSFNLEQRRHIRCEDCDIASVFDPTLEVAINRDMAYARQGGNTMKQLDDA